jgi:predicted permease
LPIQNPGELVEVRIMGGNGGMGLNPGNYEGLTRLIWQEIRNQQQAFAGVFAWAASEVNVGHGAELRRVKAIRVSGDFFRILGIQPWRGRLILPEDETGCPESRVVVSYSYWQGEMGGGEIGSGSALVVDGVLKQVIGVTPPDFFGLSVGDRFDVALPFCQPKELRSDVFDTVVMGRLRPGWTLQRASTHLQAISPGILEATIPVGHSARTIDAYKRFRLAAFPASAGISSLRKQYNSSLWLLLALSGLVLLIACANLANLMLARATTREHEMAVRLALGASRARLLRQLLVEAALLAGLGAVLGVGIAQFLSRILVRALSTGSNSVHLAIAKDWRVLLFAAVAATVTCLIFGLAPAWRLTNAGPLSGIKARGRGIAGNHDRFSMQRLMIVTQIAVSLVLLVGALLFVRSFRKLMTFDPGMREANITVAILAFHQSNVAPSQYGKFSRQLLDEVRSIPGTLGAASTTNIPLLGSSWEHGINLGSAEGSSKFTWVSPGYFQTMGIPLIIGRDFNASDSSASPRVAVVNQTFVRRFLSGSNPIGKTLRTVQEPHYPSAVYEIVGVIEDTKYNDLRSKTPPMTFAPAAQFPDPGPWTVMMIHSSRDPALAISTLKRKIAENHPEIVTVSADFQTWIRDGLVRERLMAMLSGFFGLLAVLLSVVGLYGVASYMMARRRNEIGIRMALGARSGQVLGMVMREASQLVAIGILIGMALSLLAGRAASSLLFGLKPYDPLTLAAAAVLLAAIASLATLQPARRAAKLDPMIALRNE